MRKTNTLTLLKETRSIKRTPLRGRYGNSASLVASHRATRLEFSSGRGLWFISLFLSAYPNRHWEPSNFWNLGSHTFLTKEQSSQCVKLSTSHSPLHLY